MPKLLYLDTARLGQMSPRARRASVDFARFASEYGCSLYLSDFLKHGAEAWPEFIRAKYLGLNEWQGVAVLKERLLQLAQARSESEVVIAARSANLMKFAAGLLCGPCRNVLITDLTWPAYKRILCQEQRHSGCRITNVPIRRRILRGQLTAPELIDEISRIYLSSQCDGLFLPLVDNLGIHLPVAQIIDRLRRKSEVRFVAIDGAQAINHVPLGLADEYCDFLVAGCHKWLRAFEPMGVGFFGHPRSAGHIRDSLRRWTDQGRISDPLLSFVDELESGRVNRFGETVAISPMILANGATVDALFKNHDENSANFENNCNLVLSAATAAGWNELGAQSDFASHIKLFRSSSAEVRRQSPDTLRQRFHVSGVAVTAYRDGVVRLSIPDSQLQSTAETSLRNAFPT